MKKLLLKEEREEMSSDLRLLHLKLVSTSRIVGGPVVDNKPTGCLDESILPRKNGSLESKTTDIKCIVMGFPETCDAVPEAPPMQVY